MNFQEMMKMQKNLLDFEDDEKESEEKKKKAKTILEQINEIKKTKEGEDWGYKDDPKYKKKVRS